MRVLLDTNVVIAAFISRGACAELLEHCARQHLLLTSPFILDELREKLMKKFKFSASEAKQVVELFASQAVSVRSDEPPEAVCRDRDDDAILAAAVAGEADCLVMGDKDLLVLGTHRGIAIVAPAAFWQHESRPARRKR